jgi:leucyl-tRNA synthetase
VQRPQWYLRVSAYVPENDRRLAELENWDENSLASQRFVLGRVDGVEVDLPTADGGALTVFTPHADALELARFVLVSPKHPGVEAWATDPEVSMRLEELRSGGLERGSRDAEAIPLIDTGSWLPSPSGGEPLPVVISPVVDGRFGATAALGIPERDHADEVIAERLAAGAAASSARSSSAASSAAPSPAGALVPRPAVRYRADDFSISRQRSWGTPIPIVYCDSCGAVPVPREQLPVLLPQDIAPTGAGNPLAESREFVETTCPSCDGPARRETDTLDCHFDALWLWIPACVPAEARAESLEDILALPDLRHWLPCGRVVAGSDSGNFVFDQRIVTKALRDIGPLAFLSDGEPFAGCLFHEMVISEGRKMSKHLGNVVDPDSLVERFGADTVRLAVLYAARPQRSLNWSDSAVLRCHRFLTQVWEYSLSRLAAAQALADGEELAAGETVGHGEAVADGEGAGREPVKDTSEHLRRRLAKWCETAVEKVTEDMEAIELHSAVRNVMRLFERIKDFEKRVLARQAQLSRADSEALIDALALLAQMLGPFVPHLAEELWIAFGHEENGAQTPWPGVSFQVPA